MKIHTIGTKKLSKIVKNLNFIQITKTGVKNVNYHPINSRNYAAAYYQTLEEVPAPLLPEKVQKNEKKLQKF